MLNCKISIITMGFNGWIWVGLKIDESSISYISTLDLL